MLRTLDLTKHYNNHVVLNSLNFTLDSGKTLAIVGPNGAGKSTLFKILAGIDRQSSGECYFAEQPIADVAPSQLGYLAEQPYYFDDFTPIEMIQFEAAMREISLSGGEMEYALDNFLINSFATTKMKNLSQGMKKRVSLACAFLGQPLVLVLDEPLNGLDIKTVFALKRQIQEVQERKTSIIISSHILNFFDGLVSQVIFLKEGLIVYESDDLGKSVEDAYKEVFEIGD